MNDDEETHEMNESTPTAGTTGTADAVDAGAEGGGAAAGPASGGRRIDLVNLVAGLVFAGMAAMFALADLDSLRDQVRFVWPTALLSLGIGMLLGTRRRDGRARGSRT